MYTKIPVEDTINYIKQLVWEYQTSFLTGHMAFNGECFQQIFVGERTLHQSFLTYTNKKVIWPVLFKRCIDDGFGITKANREEIEYWVEEFNFLREIEIWKRGRFYGFFFFKGD